MKRSTPRRSPVRRSSTPRSPSVATRIAKHPFFKGLAPAHVRAVIPCATLVTFSVGRYMFREGQESNVFYAICEGQVAVEVAVPGEGAIGIQILGPGEVLGWSWLVPPHKKRFDARALDEVVAVQFDARCLRTKCEQDPALGYAFLQRTVRILGQRLQASRFKLLDRYNIHRPH